MAHSEGESLATVSRRLEALVDARLLGQLSADEQREYKRLITLESALIKLRSGSAGAPDT